MKIKAANGFARILKSEGIPWVSCYPTNHVNNALGEEGVPILVMGEERFAVAVADGFSRVTSGKRIGVCTVMANLNAAGIQMAYGAIAQAWEDSSPLLVIAEGVGQGASRHTHFDMAEAFRPVTKWVGKIDRADLVPDYLRRAFTQLRSGRPGPVLLVVPRDLGEYDDAEHPYTPVKGWRSGPDPDDVKTAVRTLLAAKDPLLYVGEGVYYADATAELLKIDELAQVTASMTLKALIAEVWARGARKRPELIEEIKGAKAAFLAKFRPLMDSTETPMNPYRVFGDLMKVLDPKSSFVTADSGNTRDQTSTVYEAQIPRGHLGWGNVSTLGFSLAGAVGAKLAFPDRQCVHVTGDAGVCYMMGNFEAIARYKIGITTLHINNGGYSGYGPGFWGGGHDPYTWKVSDHASACMANMAKSVGFYGEDVTQPSEVLPALKRALDENAKGRPAFLEFICSHHPVHGGWVRPGAGGGH